MNRWIVSYRVCTYALSLTLKQNLWVGGWPGNPKQKGAELRLISCLVVVVFSEEKIICVSGWSIQKWILSSVFLQWASPHHFRDTLSKIENVLLVLAECTSVLANDVPPDPPLSAT